MNNEAAKIILETMRMSQNNVLIAAIELCRGMEGACNECCARAIDDFRKQICKDVIGSEGEAVN